MAKFKLKKDAYRAGKYYRAGSEFPCTGDQLPPKDAIPLDEDAKKLLEKLAKERAAKISPAAKAGPVPVEKK